MASERLEVRLDEEHRRRLDVILARRGTPLAAVVREMIDQTYEEVCREERRKAVEELRAMAIGDAVEPDVMCRQLDEAHDPGLP
jgi:predicted DNA-binding protein